ncbi:hypothetical protein AB0D68_11005 [Streptomyces sp. NPDC048212]|uniref:hypothetical protein n=1 Tax=Streptomyces sp. NPDC048212 TaxID=3156658 RepID=UPI0033E18B3F
MSVREEILSHLVNSLNQEMVFTHEAETAAEKLIEGLLHEEAEKVREDSKSALVQQGGKFQAGELHAADLIDPYSK